MTVHNHPPYRPVCNERVVDGKLQGACMRTAEQDSTPLEGRQSDMDETWRRIDRNTPEAFWDVSTWVSDGNYVNGSLDVADRRRIGLALLAALDGTR